MSTWRLLRFTGDIPTYLSAKWRLLRFTGETADVPVTPPPPDPTGEVIITAPDVSEPFEIVTIQASTPGPVASFQFTSIGGPGLTFIEESTDLVTGLAIRSFEAPAIYDGVICEIRVTVSRTGGDLIAEHEIAIGPVLFLRILPDGTEEPVRWGLIVSDEEEIPEVNNDLYSDVYQNTYSAVPDGNTYFNAYANTY